MSEIAQFSLTVVKASYEKDEPDPNKKRRITLTSSDTSPDLSTERMSLELFQDFVDRIENNTPVPEEFKSVVCEDGVWCGGMPYISIAHYRAGTDAKNVPGTVESVYVDGKQLKSKAYLHDTPLGRKLFDALCDDLKHYKSGTPKEKPVRVSIMFLDLEHVHEVGGKSFVFTRKSLGQVCDLCEQKAGGKIYKKGILVHEAATRYPMNQRTNMLLEEKSMSDEVLTKKDDAASIVGDELAEQLEQKSLASDVLVVKSDSDTVPASNDDDVRKAIEALTETVKSQAAVLDEVKANYEKLQAEKSVPVEETKMEAQVETPKQDEAPVQEEKSGLDKAFETLKSVIASAKGGDEVQNAFNVLGQEVVKMYTPPAAETAAPDIAAIVKSAVEAAVAPLQIEVAQLKAATAQPVQKSQVPASRALKPADLLLAKSASQPEQKQLSQIQQIARRSVGLQ